VTQTGADQDFNRSSRDYCGNHRRKSKGCFGDRLRPCNNHVYADENQAGIGDEVIQQGSFGGGSAPADTIGTLSDFEPIVFTTSANNTIDAAIALSPPGKLGNATPSDGYGTPRSETVAVNLNQQVQKYGRTTSLTAKGRITGINATISIGYDTGTARFVNQIIVESRKPGFI